MLNQFNHGVFSLLRIDKRAIRLSFNGCLTMGDMSAVTLIIDM
jgi:hypothetical protein